jgi:hypothetical protein
MEVLEVVGRILVLEVQETLQVHHPSQGIMEVQELVVNVTGWWRWCWCCWSNGSTGGNGGAWYSFFNNRFISNKSRWRRRWWTADGSGLLVLEELVVVERWFRSNWYKLELLILVVVEVEVLLMVQRSWWCWW